MEGDGDLFERLVQEEMERQLDAVKRRGDGLQLAAGFKAGNGTGQDESGQGRESERRTQFPNSQDAFRAAEKEVRDSWMGNAVPAEKNSLMRGREMYGTQDISIPGSKASSPNFPTSPLTNAIGFGRGINTLGSGLTPEQLERQRRVELEKKLAYQRELDVQLQEKQGQKAAPAEKSAARPAMLRESSPIRPPMGILPADNRELSAKEAQRRKQEEYARTLEIQMQEQRARKQREKEEAEEYDRKYGISLPPAAPGSVPGMSPEESRRNNGNFTSRLSLSSATLPGPYVEEARVNSARVGQGELPGNRDDVLQKQAQQLQVKSTLQDQIEERKRLAEETRVRQAQIEAADEARIRRELMEMNAAFERENRMATPRHAVDSNERDTFHAGTLNAGTMVKTTARAVVSPKQPSEDRHALSLAREDRTTMLDLAADLQAKRGEVLEMRRQHETLERELERQRQEIMQLKAQNSKGQWPAPLASPDRRDSEFRDDDNTARLRRRQPVASVSSPVPDPAFESRPRLSPVRYSSPPVAPRPAKASPVPDPAFESRPKLSHSIDFSNPASESFAGTTTSMRSMMEQSMPSDSLLVSLLGGGALFPVVAPKGEVKAHHRHRRVLRAVSESPKSVISREDESVATGYRDSEDDGDDEESVLQRSLPCASRYFVYVGGVQPVATDNSRQDARKSGSSKWRAPMTPPESFRDDDEELRNALSPNVDQGGSPLIEEQRIRWGSGDGDDEDISLERKDSCVFEDQDDSYMLNELEQSRVRTAHAARMALERAASAYSEDDDSVSHGEVSEAAMGTGRSRSATSPASATSFASSAGSFASEFLGKPFDEENRRNTANMNKDADGRAPLTPPRKNRVAALADRSSPQPKWEPFKVYRNTFASGAGLDRKEASSMRSSSPSDAEGGSEDEYVTYASDDLKR